MLPQEQAMQRAREKLEQMGYSREEFPQLEAIFNTDPNLRGLIFHFPEIAMEITSLYYRAALLSQPVKHARSPNEEDLKLLKEMHIEWSE